jgi:hypothetical protein
MASAINNKIAGTLRAVILGGRLGIIKAPNGVIQDYLSYYSERKSSSIHPPQPSPLKGEGV